MADYYIISYKKNYLKLKELEVTAKVKNVIALKRRYSSRTFRYGYLVTT